MIHSIYSATACLWPPSINVPDVKLAYSLVERQGMKKSGFKEEQIIGILKEYRAGLSSTELCRIARHQRCSVLQVALEVQRYGSIRGQAADGSGRGKRQPPRPYRYRSRRWRHCTRNRQKVACTRCDLYQLKYRLPESFQTLQAPNNEYMWKDCMIWAAI